MCIRDSLGTHYVALPCARPRPGGAAAARSARCTHYGRRLMLGLGQEAGRRPVARFVLVCAWCVCVCVWWRWWAH
eukprot:4457922-Alexandrium_andersonii.AAC.1